QDFYLTVCHTTSLSISMSDFLTVFFSSRRRHTRFSRDWSSDVCSSDLSRIPAAHTVRPGVPAAWIRRRRRAATAGSLSLEGADRERKSVVQGKRGDVVGRRTIGVEDMISDTRRDKWNERSVGKGCIDS